MARRRTGRGASPSASFQIPIGAIPWIAFYWTQTSCLVWFGQHHGRSRRMRNTRSAPTMSSRARQSSAKGSSWLWRKSSAGDSGDEPASRKSSFVCLSSKSTNQPSFEHTHSSTLGRTARPSTRRARHRRRNPPDPCNKTTFGLPRPRMRAVRTTLDGHGFSTIWTESGWHLSVYARMVHRIENHYARLEVSATA